MNTIDSSKEDLRNKISQYTDVLKNWSDSDIYELASDIIITAWGLNNNEQSRRFDRFEIGEIKFENNEFTAYVKDRSSDKQQSVTFTLHKLGRGRYFIYERSLPHDKKGE